MDILSILNNKNIKALQKREEIINIIENKLLSIEEIKSLDLDDKKISIVLEAMEDITRTRPEISDLGWLLFAQDNIDSPSNNVKREASRVVGNIAHLYEDNLDISIEKLLNNTKDEGTVIRWGSGYGLGRIIVIPKYAKSQLFDKLQVICDNEEENGVKNQYVKALKKAQKLRI